MIYCTATENGYEQISGKSINVFFPTFGKDKEGNDIITEPAQATTGDFITLALAAIVAAATRDEQEPPITGKYLLYEATSQERTDLLTAIVELRNQWYEVPKVVNAMLKQDAAEAKADGNGGDEEPKNA